MGISIEQRRLGQTVYVSLSRDCGNLQRNGHANVQCFYDEMRF